MSSSAGIGGANGSQFTAYFGRWRDARIATGFKLLQMHPRLIPLVDDIRRQRAALIAATDGQPAEILDQKASTDSWSPAEILEHIAIVETNVARLLAKRLMRAKEAGLDKETSIEPVSAPLEDAFLTQKIDAPDNVRPTSTVPAATALERLQTSHQELLELLETADGYDLTKVMARHQIFGELNMYEWLIFLAKHEQRHVVQLKRMLETHV
jgi:hypothetical protein